MAASGPDRAARSVLRPDRIYEYNPPNKTRNSPCPVINESVRWQNAVISTLAQPREATEI